MIKKLVSVATVAFLVFAMFGNVNAQNTGNKMINGVEITNPIDGKLVPRRIPVEGTVEFNKNIEPESFVVLVSVLAADQNHYLVSWNRAIRHARLSTVTENGKYIANWEIGKVYGPAYIGRENADIGKEFYLQAIVLKTSDLQKFEDKYFTTLPEGEVCIIDKDDFSRIDETFPMAVVSEPITVIRKEGE